MGADLLAAGVIAFALTYLIHSTLLLVGAWLLTNTLPARSALLRERIWRVAFLGGFATAGMQLALGIETPVVHWALSPEPAVVEELAPREQRAQPVRRPAGSVIEFRTPWVGAAPRRALPRVPETAAPIEEPVAVAVRDEPPVDAPGDAPGDAPAARLAPTTTAVTSGVPVEPVGTLPDGPPAWTTWIALAWAAAGLAVLGFFAVLVVRLKRSLAGRRELDSGPLPVLLAELRRRAGVRTRVRLYLAPRLTAPISVGWLCPAICVPPRALTDLAPEEQEAMLAHELAHLARRDPPWFFTCWLIESLFFFQPLNRLARRRLQGAAEILCDDWAVRHTGRDLSLASCLARIAEWIVKQPRPLLAAHMTHGVPATAGRARSRLGQRIERLLDDHKVQEPARRWIPVASTALLASLTLVGPGVAAVGGGDPLVSEPDPAPAPRPQRRPEPRPEPRPQPDPESHPEPEDVLPIQPGELFGAATPTRPARPAGSPLQGELVSLDEEVALLEVELRELRADLGQLDLDPRFDEALNELETATRGLDERRRRLEFLVQRAQARGLRP